LHKNQYITLAIAILTILSLFLFGNIKQPQSSFVQQQQSSIASLQSLEAETAIKMTAAQKQTLQNLKIEIDNSKTVTEKMAAYNKLAMFYQNEIESEELTAYYGAAELKLENSQKKLKFAANYILGDVINFDGPAANRGFRAEIAKGLFEQALLNEPNNDSLTIGLAGCYMHGATSDNPMKGTQMVLGIVGKDSSNAFAQKMLGYGGLVSQQLDKALSRFTKSYELNKTDTSLAMRIAINAKRWGNTTIAKDYFEKTKQLLIKNPEMLKLFEEEYVSIK
jgi:tetratricopeptide (TPR) repeat protein